MCMWLIKGAEMRVGCEHEGWAGCDHGPLQHINYQSTECAGATKYFPALQEFLGHCQVCSIKVPRKPFWDCQLSWIFILKIVHQILETLNVTGPTHPHAHTHTKHNVSFSQGIMMYKLMYHGHKMHNIQELYIFYRKLRFSKGLWQWLVLYMTVRLNTVHFVAYIWYTWYFGICLYSHPQVICCQ